jgi:UDP-N-acetylmuramoyl-L-alanyl-D-glutamate--2,6-diaminopimelate ligase
MIKTESKASLQMNDIQHLMLSEVESAAHLSSDTRLLKSGDVFLAYPVGSGKGFSDNRIHIPKALELGVNLVLYENNSWLEDELIQAREKLGDSRCYPVPGLASMASEIADWWYGYPSKEMSMIGVTGTNGKTTVTQWLAQSMNKYKKTAVFGTLGYGEVGTLKTTGFTTPDAARVQRVLAELKAQSFDQVAMEVSSHALEQGRVSHVQFKTAIFTNLSQDHLDYHGDMREYARAKFELFRYSSLEKIILNMDDPIGREWIEQLSKKSKAKLWVYGSQESLEQLNDQDQLSTVLVEDYEITKNGVKFNCVVNGQSLPIHLDIIGRFNVDNMMAVLATLLANEIPLESAIAQLKQLKSVDGRLEMMNLNDLKHPLMVVDFAHTPDALEKVLTALKPIAKARGGELVCVFGCGGNRDASKRPMMGKLAANLADRVILTSDNPRGEKPEDIIEQIMQGIDSESLSKVTIVVDRAFAILSSVKQAQPNDLVLVAGKGHERVQEIASNQFIFSDQDHIRLAIRGVM